VDYEMAKMLRAVPDGWFSYNFTVFDRSGTPVARADLSKWLWLETAKLEISATSYEAYSKRLAHKEFLLEKEDGRVVAVAEKPSFWRNRRVIEHAGNRYELKKESAWRNTFVLWRDGVGPIGSVRSNGVFKREWTVELREELPMEVGVFVMWLMVIMWKLTLSSAAELSGPVGGGG
jgi:hypothetical protein